MCKKIVWIAVLLLCLTGCSNATKKDDNQGNNMDSQNEDQNNENNVTNQGNDTANHGNENTTSNANGAQYMTEHVEITDGQEALARLQEGNQRFLNNESLLINVTDERRNALENGQTPYAVIVSCSDSRITPTTIFNVGLGEIFDVRLAGNILNEEALGSVEYGIEHLHAPLLVIMGHESCGAVTAAYDKMTKDAEVEGNINSIVDQIEPAITDANDVDEAIHMNVDYVTEEVMKDDIVRHLVESGKLLVMKAYYSLDGQVTFVQADQSITDTMNNVQGDSTENVTQ